LFLGIPLKTGAIQAFERWGDATESGTTDSSIRRAKYKSFFAPGKQLISNSWIATGVYERFTLYAATIDRLHSPGPFWRLGSTALIASLLLPSKAGKNLAPVKGQMEQIHPDILPGNEPL
jgi:hypothetical protein